ncbi:MAG: Fe-S protein assembly co-chaperone HscB [Gammaproteobacteria bacterium]|nr:MAG: Fe-S protein assembly co-chaperone HscB [Gammaproteobacteria bacterium]
MTAPVDLAQDYFSLFGLEPGPEVDRAALDARYRALQSQLHPDRFASAGAQERRLSVQSAGFVNEAYETLKDPLRRLKYLLELRGVHLDADKDTTSDPAFLMQQMELRERLEEAGQGDDPLAELDALARELRDWQRALQKEFAEAWASNDLDAAREAALKLQFFRRVNDELQRKQEQIEEQLL